jgi:protocatechuate 3,4-dioxygenase beta subunit
MKRHSSLTPAKLTLLMLGVGTVALMGVPGFGHYNPPQGAVTGSVVDTRGFAQEDIEVALFDDHELSLLALTRTDSHGRFAFHQVPPRFHVFARPVGDEELVGAWLLSSERAPVNHVELTLAAGHPLTVEVQTAAGIAVSRAEVRVYDPAGGSTAVHRVSTDLEGRATVIAPPRAHVAVLAHEGLAPVWMFDQEIPEQGLTLAVTLTSAEGITGRVLDDEGAPLANMVVSGWEFGNTEDWTGYTLTDETGAFRLRTRTGEAFVRAVDPEQGHLPAVQVIGSAPETAPATLVLETGHPLEIRTRYEGEGVPARVWTWSESAGTWGWGATTDPDGLLRTVVSTVHGLVADPLDEGFEGTEALSLTYQGPSRMLSLHKVESVSEPQIPEPLAPN